MSIDKATNSRFHEIDTDTYSELIATQLQIFYDPSTGSVRVHFNGQPFLTVGSKLMQLDATFDILSVELGSQMTKCYGPADVADPVTGADLSKISVAGLMLLLKNAYDMEHNAEAERVAAAIAEAEAARAAAAAQANTTP